MLHSRERWSYVKYTVYLYLHFSKATNLSYSVRYAQLHNWPADVAAIATSAHSCLLPGQSSASRRKAVSVRISFARAVVAARRIVYSGCVCFCYKMAFNGEGPHTKRQRTDTDPASNRVSTPQKNFKTRPMLSIITGMVLTLSFFHWSSADDVLKKLSSAGFLLFFVCYLVFVWRLPRFSVNVGDDALDQLFSVVVLWFVIHSCIHSVLPIV